MTAAGCSMFAMSRKAPPPKVEYSRKAEAKAKAEGGPRRGDFRQGALEIAQLPNDERKDFLDSIGLGRTGPQPHDLRRL